MRQEQQRTVAVVNDDLTLVDTLGELLSEVRFQALSSSAYWRTYYDIRATRPDVVVLDMQGQAVQGVTIYNTLRNDLRTTDTPVIFITDDRATLLKLLPTSGLKKLLILVTPVSAGAVVEAIRDTAGVPATRRHR